MPWVRIDDHFNEHPKHARVGPLAWGIWLAGLAYCNRNLTDGFIPRSVAMTLACFEVVDSEGRVWKLARTNGTNSEDVDMEWVIQLLVDAGLWEEVPGGYRVHDYLEYQPSKDEILSEREKKREAGRKGGLASGRVRRARAEARAKAGAEADAEARAEAGALAGAQADAKARGQADGQAPMNHRKAAVEGSEAPAQATAQARAQAPASADAKQVLQKGSNEAPAQARASARAQAGAQAKPKPVPDPVSRTDRSSTSLDSADGEKKPGWMEGGSGGKPTAHTTNPVLSLSDTQRMALEVLRSVPGWPADDAKDAQLLSDLASEYPDVNLLAEAKNWRTYKLDRPLSKQSNPRLQFRNWVRIAHERRLKREASAPGQPSPEGEQEPGDAWSRGWRPYYRRVPEEELAYYRGEIDTPPASLRGGGSADGDS